MLAFQFLDERGNDFAAVFFGNEAVLPIVRAVRLRISSRPRSLASTRRRCDVLFALRRFARRRLRPGGVVVDAHDRDMVGIRQRRQGVRHQFAGLFERVFAVEMLDFIFGNFADDGFQAVALPFEPLRRELRPLCGSSSMTSASTCPSQFVLIHLPKPLPAILPAFGLSTPKNVAPGIGNINGDNRNVFRLELFHDDFAEFLRRFEIR